MNFVNNFNVLLCKIGAPLNCSLTLLLKMKITQLLGFQKAQHFLDCYEFYSLVYTYSHVCQMPDLFKRFSKIAQNAVCSTWHSRPIFMLPNGGYG